MQILLYIAIYKEVKSTMEKKIKVAILGAGYGGVHAAKLLNKASKRRKDLDILLIDKKPFHTLMTELHEVAGNRVSPESVQIDIREIFSASQVEVVTDEVKRVDFKGQRLYTDSAQYDYDYLVLGTGAEPVFFGTPGVQEHGFTIWAFEDSLRIKEHIGEMFRKARVERDPDKRKAMLTFVVAGAGFTGIETMGELVEWKRELCREYEIADDEVRLVVVEAMAKILPILDEGLIKKAERFLRKCKVEVFAGAPITRVDKVSISLKDGKEIPTRTLIWTCGIKGSDFGENTGLTVGGRGRIQVNEYMQSVDYENVYAVGDNAYYEEVNEKGEKKPIPQIVETALQTAETAVHNILASVDGKNGKPFKSNYHGIMVSIGSRYAVANLSGISLSGFFAMLIKHLVNIHYQFGVAGMSRVWTYIVHEFVHVRENRSIFGGHFSAKAPTLWLAVLRVYLGVIWLIEGLKKVREGWLDPGKNFINAMPKPWDAPLNNTDAVTNATSIAYYQPVPMLKKPPAFYQWFTENFVEPNAYLFQVAVTLGEIAAGVALIVGFLTILASVASIFLCINFILSGMAGTEILWHIFTAIAMFGGAGRAFGLDYYFIPRLKNWWKRTAFARKTYLYVK